MRTIPSRIRGFGVEVRHSRRCARTRNRAEACTCDPSFRGEVWDCKLGRKLRSPALPTERDARLWRLIELRKLYGVETPKGGRADKAYALLRQTQQELDRAIPEMAERPRLAGRRALDALYAAEDALLDALAQT